MTKNFLLWGIVFVVLVVVFSNYSSRQGEGQKLSYTQFLQSVELR